MRRDLSNARSHAGASGEDSGAGHAMTSGYDERVPHVALVGEVGAEQEYGAYLALLKHTVRHLGIANIVGTKPDVKHAQPANVLLAVGKKHRQLHLLQREREISPDNVGADVVAIVLAHQP